MKVIDLKYPGKYHPGGTNILLCTIVGNNWERVVTLTDEQANIDGVALDDEEYSGGDNCVSQQL